MSTAAKVTCSATPASPCPVAPTASAATCTSAIPTVWLSLLQVADEFITAADTLRGQ